MTNPKIISRAQINVTMPHVRFGERLGETEPGRPGHRVPSRLSTYGWLMLHRRLARDYETRPARSEAMIHLAMTDLMARRLTSENTISWRDPTPQTKQQIPG